MGVPFEGRYKELINSSDKVFGGEGCQNKRVKTSKKKEAHERENSIEITVAPLSVAVFSCTPVNVKTTKRVVIKKDKKVKQENLT